MPITYTLEFAVALALINFWLAMRAGATRTKAKVSIGSGGHPLLEARMRAHANFNEYVPLALILMGLIEYRVGPSRLLFALGALLVAARVAHPFGMERPIPNFLRAGGIIVTFGVTLALIVWGALILYGVV